MPEARLLAVLVLVPMAPTFYEALPLGLVPRTRRQMMVAVALSQIALVGAFVLLREPPTIQEWVALAWPYYLLLVYLPALALLAWQARRERSSADSRHAP